MKRQRGFTYLALLLAVVLLGLGLAAAGSVWQVQNRRDKEQALLDAGRELRAALGRYYKASPAPPFHYPDRLEDLLQDPRYPFLRRHLRRVPRDPLSGRAEWGLIRAPGGGIVGVHTLADGAPLKLSGFMEGEQSFNQAAHYSDWRFVHNPDASPPKTVSPRPVVP
jgi:type II secretory pathway pseudopilin PulG